VTVFCLRKILGLGAARNGCHWCISWVYILAKSKYPHFVKSQAKSHWGTLYVGGSLFPGAPHDNFCLPLFVFLFPGAPLGKEAFEVPGAPLGKEACEVPGVLLGGEAYGAPVEYEGVFPGAPLGGEACEVPEGVCGISPGPLNIMWGSGGAAALKEPVKTEARISIIRGSCNGPSKAKHNNILSIYFSG